MMSFKRTSGFTIVEILIVIVVIGILAGITIVAYNGVSNTASNAVRMDELRSWDKQFQLYMALQGHYPTLANGGYCLGTGFPDIDLSGLGNCRESNVPGPTRYQSNAYLNSELSKVATLPHGLRVVVVAGAGALGPYVEYYSATYLQLKTIIKCSSCPAGSFSSYYLDK
jgi:prepilin-type N-terminal cleavage/methylation domain-containing protein